MNKENFNRIMAGLEEARRHAAGEDVPGMVIHKPTRDCATNNARVVPVEPCDCGCREAWASNVVERRGRGRPPVAPCAVRIRQRFLDSIAIDGETGCWNWQRTLTHNGYGEMYLYSVAGKASKIRAHRYSYEYVSGPIPLGLQIDHLCRNRRCVNPDHLECVTPLINTMRGLSPSAHHAKKTHCPRGHVYDRHIIGKTGRPERRCRTCERVTWREAKRRQVERERAARSP